MSIPKGILVSIGGNVDKGSGDEPAAVGVKSIPFFGDGVLRRTIAEMQGSDSYVEIITTASEIPNEVGQNYLEAFGRLGCTRTGIMHIRTREDAMNPEYIERIKKADGVMFTGGNQMRLTTIFGGTRFLSTLHDRYMNDKFVIAGTSAGAMAMSNTMIYEGSSAEALLKGKVKITTGLGFLKGVIIDSHFVVRGRFGRLTQAVCANPGCIGIGLGEDTAILVRNGNDLEAIGAGLVLIFDGHEIKHCNIAGIQDGDPISVEHMVVHVLTKGNHYHLKERKFIASL
jgi:cyanophycinase